jgi:hypothetical protein
MFKSYYWRGLWFVHALAKNLITNAQKFNNLQVTFIHVASFAHNWRFLPCEWGCITWTSPGFEALVITDQHWFALQYSWTYHECLAERFPLPSTNINLHSHTHGHIMNVLQLEIPLPSTNTSLHSHTHGHIMNVFAERFHFHQPTPVCTPILMDIYHECLAREISSPSPRRNLSLPCHVIGLWVAHDDETSFFSF